MEVVGREKLEVVAAMRPTPPPREEARFGPGRNGYQEFDLEAWIGEHGVPVKREGLWGKDGYRWVLEECPWNGHTDNAAYIVRFAGGAIAAGCHHNSCQGYRWRDLREYYEPGAYERNAQQAGQSEAALGVDEWEPPAPLPNGLPSVDTFDPVMLPECLKGWLEDIAERMQVPLDYLAAGAMVVISSLVGRKLGIYPKKRDDWIVVPNLWGMIVGRSALLKSPALAEVMKPLGRLIADAHEAHKEELADYAIEAMVAEAEAKALRKYIEQLASEAAKSGDRSKLMEAAKTEGAEASEPPTLRRYKTEDATVEKIGDLLVQNPQGILNHRDELSGWFRSLDKQGREGDRAFYLESWNGTGSFDVDRIGRGSTHIPALCLSILGGIQPGPLSSYVYQAVQGQEGADGLLQRFQLTVWPDPPKSWRNVDRYPDTEAKYRVYEVFRKLDSLKANETEDEEVPALRFDAEAQEVFDTWRDDLEQRLRSEEMAPALEAHVAKYRSLMPSLALLFELVDTEDLPANVGKTAALRAVAWCEYLETHAGRLYASAEKPAMEEGRALLERIRKGDVKDASSVRDIYRGRHWSKLSTSEEVSAAAAVLEEYG
ncbi:MAG TPA: YfjI family protein [Rubrobacteraceae bacterium]|nr:YfjI family protein [Rubrobacteraceae bacterium]